MNALLVAMRETPVPRQAWVRAILTIGLAACGDVGPNTPSVATVEVTPGALSLHIGQTGHLSATPRDQAGNALSGHQVSWTSLTPAVASVDGAGLVTALATGTATISATSESRSGSALVTVSPVPVTTVAVTPDSLDLIVGQPGQLAATARDSAGNGLSGRTVTWGSLNPSIATVDNTGLVTAVGAGKTTVSATSEGRTGTAVVKVHEMLAGLDFPGNLGVPPPHTMRFEFTAPLAAYPATYIWRVYPRDQEGYYTAFFHAGNSSDFDLHLGDFEYYGFHPYPWPTYQPGAVPKWEISVDQTDITGDSVVFERWYLQVAVVYKTGTNTYHTYYWDWPDTTHKITWVGGLKPPPPNAAIMVGDNPWNPGEEVFDGVMRGFQFYDDTLTLNQIGQEIDAPGSVRQPWYLNLNPTPDDILDRSGHGHNPSWVDLRATLWTGIGP